MRRNEQRMLGAVFFDVVADLIRIKLGNYNYLKTESQRHMQT